MKKYQATTGYFPAIDLFDAERETDHFVWIDGIKAHKSNKYESYHDTFGKAKQYLLELALSQVEEKMTKLQRCQIALARVQKIKDIE